MKSASPERLEANRANAQQSTGPRTEAGKQASSQNALKHGLNASKPHVRPDERELFALFEQDLLAELLPSGALEADICDKILHAAWNLRRLRQLEEALSLEYDDPFTHPETERKMISYARHTARFERIHRSALRDLRQLQTDRNLAVHTTNSGPVILTPLTDIAKLLKRTQAGTKKQRPEPEPDFDSEELAAAQAHFEEVCAAHARSEPHPPAS